MSRVVLLDAGPLGLVSVIATTNVGHLSRFVPAHLWTEIEPLT